MDIEELYEMYDGDYTDEQLQEWLDQFPDRDLGPGPWTIRIPATWNGVETRLGRYLGDSCCMVSPLQALLALNQSLGYREMRRFAQLDKRTCRRLYELGLNGLAANRLATSSWF